MEFDNCVNYYKKKLENKTSSIIFSKNAVINSLIYNFQLFNSKYKINIHILLAQLFNNYNNTLFRRSIFRKHN